MFYAHTTLRVSKVSTTAQGALTTTALATLDSGCGPKQKRVTERLAIFFYCLRLSAVRTPLLVL